VIFDDLVPKEEVWPADSHWSRRRADALIKRYQQTFPLIHYDLFWDTRLLNAQAFIGGRGRCVRLYGGLGRHRKVGIEGLAFALAHETGHHLGGPPRHPFYSSLSSERRASEWALTSGLPQVFGDTVGQRYGRHGLIQLAALWPRHLSDIDPAPFDFCCDDVPERVVSSTF
jgi:Zn-dependent protease with chaperone function